MVTGQKQSKFIYECTDCGKNYSGLDTLYLCPSCSSGNSKNLPPKGVLKTIYDYHQIKKSFKGFSELKQRGFIDLLPIEKLSSLPGLRVGGTPLYSYNKLDNRGLPFNLFLKDDSQNPTFSFKDRASAIVSAYAKEKNLDTIIAASTGNAGSSLAGICAAQDQHAIILVPEKAPRAKLTQILMYGARIIPVRGTYDEAFDLSIKATEKFGWYNRNTAYNPFTIEGKKTVSYELAEQLNFRVPDRIFVPVGDGVIISGVYKGFEEMYLLGITDRMPVIVSVQAEGSDNLNRNLISESFEIKRADTLADSISVDIPRNFYMARKFIKTYYGENITVSDSNIISSSVILSGNTGLFAEPAATAAFAGFLSYYHAGKIADNSDNVILLTGSGLKDPSPVWNILKMPEPVNPTIDDLKSIL